MCVCAGKSSHLARGYKKPKNELFTHTHTHTQPLGSGQWKWDGGRKYQAWPLNENKATLNPALKIINIWKVTVRLWCLSF